MISHYKTALAVTTSNTVNIDGTTTALGMPVDALWIGGAGTGALKVIMEDGSDATFAGVPVGFFPIRCRRVYATGTGVTNILALIKRPEDC